MAPKGLLFDFDGTLVRSMEDNFMAWQEALKELSVTIQPEDYYPLEGTSVKKLAEIFLAKATHPKLTTEELVKKKESAFKKIHRFSTYPGVTQLLDLLDSKNIPRGIVTAGLKDRLNETVPKSFFARFNCVITGDMTERGKPHPDPYLTGAKALGLRPEECIVVENAPLGIQAGKSAGCFCIAVCSTVQAKNFQMADMVVDSFEKLPKLEIITNL